MKQRYAQSKNRILGLAILLLSCLETASAQVHFSENFNAATMPAGWTVTNGGSTAETWKIQAPFIYTSVPDTINMLNSNYLFSNGDVNGSGSVTDELIETPVISATGSIINLTLDHYFKKAPDSFLDTGLIDVFNGTQWVNIYKVFTLTGTGKSPASLILGLTQYNNPQMKLRFRHKGNWPWYWAIDNVKIYTPTATDVGVQAIKLPVTCMLPASSQVSVSLVNYGSVSQSGIPVRYSVNNQAPVLETFSGSVPPGDTVEYTFTTPFIASAPGNYTFKAWTTLANDGDATNDSTIGVVGRRPGTGLAKVDFESYNGDNLSTTNPGWREQTGLPPTGQFSDWALSNSDQGTVFGTATARVNLYFNDNRAWIISPAVTPPAGAVVKFKLAVTDFGGNDPIEMGSDDSLIVKVSTNCGATWTNVRSFTVADQLTNDLTSVLVPLTAFEGQDIIIGFYATDGDVNDDPDYDVHLDDIEVMVPSPTDVGVASLLLPNLECGVPPSFSLTARLYNNGNATQTSFPVKYRIDGQAVVTETFTGSLAPGAFVNYAFTTPVVLATPGNHFISAWTNLTDDLNTLNDSVVNVKVVKPGTVLSLVNFNGFDGTNLSTLFTGWREKDGVPPVGTTSSWLNSPQNEIDTLGSITAKVNLYSDFNREWMISPPVSPVEGTVLKFKVAVTDYNDPAIATMGSDDSMSVMVSNDCGQTWTRLVSYTVANNLGNHLVEKAVPLTQFAGQSINIGFFATDGDVVDDNDYDFHVDDVQVLLPADNDVGVASLVLPNSECGYPSSLNLIARIFNYGSQSQSNIPVQYSVNGQAPVSGTVAGPLTPGASIDYTFATTVDLSNPGTYFISAWTNLSGDASALNDSVKNVKLVKAGNTFPVVSFGGYTGANLAAIAAGWKESKGAVPAGTASEWTSSSAIQEAGLGSTTAKINLLANSKKEWIIGSGFSADVNSFVKFKAAITASSTAAAYAQGMGTDDSVNVMVSTNCGQTWNQVFSFTNVNALTNQLTQQSIPLGAYAGQNALVAFFATEGSVNDVNNYDFHIDDIDVSPFTSIATSSGQANISLFPNPVNGSFEMKGMARGEYDLLTIRSVEGREVQTIRLNENLSGQYQVKEAVANGMYFGELTGKEKRASVMFILKR